MILLSFDWNWFFSSFSQSAAALLGIIAAFVISRLIGISEKINGLIDEFEDLKIHFFKLKEGLNVRRFKWYNSAIIEDDEDLKFQISNGDFDNLSKPEIVKKIYENDDRIFNDDASILESYENVVSGIGSSFRTRFADVKPVGFWNSVQEEKEKINHLTLESRSLIKKFVLNLNGLSKFTANLKVIKSIIIILIIAFPLTVIYPLDFMPVTPDKDPSLTFDLFKIISHLFSLKGIMLGIFFVVIEGIFLYFNSMVKELNRLLLKTLNEHGFEYRNLSSYSPYLRESL